MRKFSEIIELIRNHKKLKSESQVAELFGFTRGGLSSHKQRNSYPFTELIGFCEREKISIDWLFLGNDDAQDQIENLKAGLRYFEKRVLELTERLRECDPDFAEKEPDPAEYFPKSHKKLKK